MKKPKLLKIILFSLIGAKAMAFTLTSSAFTEKSTIPSEYTCDGKNLALPLAWSDAPQGTQSFALIFDDKDAPNGLWTHWVVWNIPASTNQLANFLPSSIKEGINSWGKNNYGGPCPPKGETHHYVFHLYALDTLLNIPEKSTQADLRNAIKGHVLDKTELMGTFGH
ncbi:MAG: hypothetical protein A3F18_03560 [Legionellales bacterium RIFCSPHIGHO2_12_FULL_37_14]|nr:MAG: hypothetical protein A3F18_03560 [Legionellales bacterium RIFCSPHIGHO2_12_FULL_37_14]